MQTKKTYKQKIPARHPARGELLYQVDKKLTQTPESVIPAQAGIQPINDFIAFNYLDPGFRRGDEAFFSTLLQLGMLPPRRTRRTRTGKVRCF